MDDRRFDHLTRVLATPDSRRNMLRRLAATPVLGGLLGILTREDAAAKDRRRRRKRRHKRRKNPGPRKKGCQPQGKAKVCAGKCGPVKNRQTCGKTVDCGSCDCNPPCGECFTCQGAAGAPGTCVPRKPGTPCGPGQTCQAGMRIPQGSCTSSGTCVPADPVPCDPYLHCADDVCASSCDNDDDCVPGAFCDEGQCRGDLPNGEGCVNDGQCASGHCANGVCCDTACSGACVACDLAGTKGTCTPLAGGTLCGDPQTCENGVLQPQGSCGGSGTCQAASPISCAPYAHCANGTTCAMTCSNDSGCVAGSFCDGSQCLPKQGNGTTCERNGECTSGHCVDGVCCDMACDSACEACKLLGSVGTCTTVDNGTSCGSGQVCCNGTCQECCNNSHCTTSTSPVCQSGTCSPCSVSPAVCTGGTCCASDGACQDGTTDTACGSSGLCDVCTGQEQCLSKTCECVPDCTGKCGGDDDGCDGACPDPCPTGQVCLENGSCAHPCNKTEDCPMCSWRNCDYDTQGAKFCLNADLGTNGQSCETSANCDPGYYCYNTGVCFALCHEIP
jgi:hypothetical protein